MIAGRTLGALLAASLLLASGIVAPALPDAGLQRISPAGSDLTVSTSTQALFALARAVDGEHSSRLRDLVEELERTPAASGTVADALAWAGIAPRKALPLPELPTGAAPLAQALLQYERAIGAPASTLDDLRDAGEGLDLPPMAEAALARLVLAYVQALQVQADALSGLDESELSALSGVHGEAQAILAAAKVDGEAMRQAADLLLRAALQAQADLALFTGMQSEASSAGWSALDAVLATPEHGPTDAASAEPVTLEHAFASLAARYGAPTTSPAGLSGAFPPSLDAAIAGIVQAHADGMGHSPWEQARLVTDATRAAAPTLLAWSALTSPSTSEDPRPDAMLATALAALGPEAAPALAAAALGTAPNKEPGASHPGLPILLERQGLTPGEATAAASSLPAQAASALAMVLAAEQGVHEAHRDALALLDPTQAMWLGQTGAIAPLLEQPSWSPAEAGAVAAWASAVHAVAPALPGLAAAQAQSVLAVQEAGHLLATLPQLAPMQSSASGEPAASPPQSPPDPFCPTTSAFSDCENDVFLELLTGQGILVTGRGSTRIDGRFAGGDAHIIIDLGGNDVYRVSAATATAGIGIPQSPVVAGLEVGPAIPGQQAPGDSAASLVEGRVFAVAIDVAGDDRYATAAMLAQGAAQGIGATGILWDLRGDDGYLQETDASAAIQQGQGAGTLGGLGILVDQRGNDTYDAPNGRAQGIGWSPAPPVAAAFCGNAGFCLFTSAQDDRQSVGGVGLLLDAGSGADRFAARQGQGHSAGVGTVGLLVDLESPTGYAVTEPSLASQGGRGAATRDGQIQVISGVDTPMPATTAGGFAALIDLGGPGDSYTSPRFPAFNDTEDPGFASLRPDGREPRKGDHTAWVGLGAGVAFGLDSSLADQDADGAPDLIELLAGSDPEDRDEKAPDPGPARATIGSIVGTVVPAAQDRDEDNWPDGVEVALGSEPDDPASTPGAKGGFLLLLGSVCAADADAACEADPVCDPARYSCVRLLAIGAANATEHDRPAIVTVDLGGNDAHPQAAGAGETRVATAGSVLVEVGGDDVYGTAAAVETLAYATGGASLLLDLGGADRYRAAARSQAAVQGAAVAILADLDGDDRYEVGSGGQAHAATVTGDDQALALLLDATGADRYTFATQASVVGRASDAQALLLDLQGADRYTSTARPSDLTDGDDATPFEMHGRLDRRAAATGHGTLSLAWFVDAGESVDQYFVTDADGARHSAPGKDGAGTVHNAPRGPSGPSAGDAGTASAMFTDGLADVLEDPDGDTWPTLAERVLGSDPTQRASVPVSQDGPQADIEPDAGTAGTGGENLRLPGLVIATSANQVHSEHVPFLVDLGGNDQYRAANAGGASTALHHLQREPATSAQARFATTLLLDVGGDDEYKPQPCVTNLATATSFVVGESPGAPGAGGASVPDAGEGVAAQGGTARVAHCPSLGGTVGGLAVLVDDGGRNTFTSRLEFDVATSSASGQDLQAMVRAWGVTQGAALFHGVGALVTLGSQNTFEATVSLSAQELNEADPKPQADAIALAQGAAWGHGVGILASLGAGKDDYSAQATASAARAAGADAGRAWATAQGAAKSGIGVLIDDGGDNTFTAPAGFAQGAAFHLSPFEPVSEPSVPGAQSGDVARGDANDAQPAVGLLRTGPGRDAFRAGPSSQGSADASGHELLALALDNGSSTSLGSQAFGWLIDGGGDDHYQVDAAAHSPFCPAFGVAPAVCSISQGALAGSGSALLLDWGGNDVYLADLLTHVQGAGAFVTQGTLNQGVLLDAAGHDRYLAYDDGQGAMGGSLVDLEGDDSYTLTNGAQGTGLFADLGGQDNYAAGKSKTPVTTVESPDGNNWIWRAGAPGSFGVDSRGLALLLGQTGLDLANVTLAVARDAQATSFYSVGEPLAGTAYLVADVQPSSQGIWTQATRRVEFFLDGELIGKGVPRAAAADGTLRFVLAWDTKDGPVAVADGEHRLKAIVLLGPEPASSRHLATPEGMHSSSLPLDVMVDNVVTGTALLSDSRLSPHVPASRVVLSVDAAGDADGQPYGLEVRLRRGNEEWALDQTSILPGGSRQVVLDGTCGPSACSDGHYTVLVDLLEAGFPAKRLPALALEIDGTAPVGALAVPRFAGPEFQAGPALLDAVWDEADEGTGVAVATLRLYAEDGTPRSTIDVAAGLQRTQVPLANGDTMRLALALRDGVGNTFDPCASTSILTCPAAVLVTADFASPRLVDTAINRTLVGPDGALRITARAWDEHTDLDSVEATVDGASDLVVALQSSGGQAHAADIVLAPDPAREAPFQVQVHATDAAGNLASSDIVEGWLDSRAPRLSVPSVTYEDGSGTPAVGRPGGKAIARLEVDDLDLSFVRVHAPDLAMPDATACVLEQGPLDGRSTWRCEVPIPSGTVGNSPRIATVQVQDDAGNPLNTTQAIVVLDGEHALISDFEVVDSGPDFIEVAWTTSKPTTGRVAYGAPDLTNGVNAVGPAATSHMVRITGLLPSTTYSLQVTVRTGANVPTTSSVLQARTAGGFEADVSIPSGAWREAIDLPLEVTSHVGSGAVFVSFRLEHDDLPDLPLHSQSFVPGLHEITLDTESAPDGTYTLVAIAVRGDDTLRQEWPGIRIDNTPPILTIKSPSPGARVAVARPNFVVSVVDPGRTDPVRVGTLELLIDGDGVATGTPALQGRNVTVTVASPLTLGGHEVTVSILDVAGNRGEVTWPFEVDVAAPASNGTPAFTPVGSRVARPGSDVDVALRLDDGAGVASARIENGVAKVALASADGLTWTGRFRVPANATHGTFEVLVRVQDGLGSNATLALPLDVDAVPPEISDAKVALDGLARVLVTVETLEPTSAVLHWTTRNAASPVGKTHTLGLNVSAPGSIVPLRLLLVDEAGNKAEVSLAATMPADLVPPSGIEKLNATSPAAGSVVLRWDPAEDDIGIHSYEVVRSLDGRTRLTVVPGGQTRFDDTVPPGSLVRYEVRAMDHAGQSGTPNATEVRALLTSVVEAVAVSPAHGPASKPFQVSFNYSHPAGLPPERIFVRYGDQEIDLADTVEGDCATACQITGTLRLPARSTAKDQPEMALVVVVDGVESEAAFDAPIVTAGKGGGVHIGKPQGAPGLDLVPLGIALLAMALWRRRPR